MSEQTGTNPVTPKAKAKRTPKELTPAEMEAKGKIERAKAVAEYFGVRLNIVDFDYRSRIPDLVEQLRPLLRSHQIASLTALTHGALADFVARTTDGDEVVFAGEISDGAHNFGFSQFVTIFHPVLAFREIRTS